jgi:hypothetical protein
VADEAAAMTAESAAAAGLFVGVMLIVTGMLFLDLRFFVIGVVIILATMAGYVLGLMKNTDD